MKKAPMILLLALAFTLSSLAFAGEKHQAHAKKRCEGNTQECLDAMAAKLKEKGYLGIKTEANDDGYYVVAKVEADSPAAAAGFQKGDVLVALNGVALKSENKEALKKAKQNLAPGKSVKYTVVRGDSKQKIAVTLGEVPDVMIAQWIGEHMIDQHSYTRVAAK